MQQQGVAGMEHGGTCRVRGGAPRALTSNRTPSRAQWRNRGFVGSGLAERPGVLCETASIEDPVSLRHAF
jgi:hypothetical protein